MGKVKRFFKIEMPYRFEWGDLRALLNLSQIIMIMKYGLKVSWYGLLLATISLIKDLYGNRHINDLATDIGNIILNIFFLGMI